MGRIREGDSDPSRRDAPRAVLAALAEIQVETKDAKQGRLLDDVEDVAALDFKRRIKLYDVEGR